MAGATKSILIIGGSGFVGTHLALRLREQFKVFVTYHSHALQIPGVTALPLAADNRNWAKRVAYTAKPDVVIYAAGNNDVDWAEGDARMAEHIHVGGPATVADVADILAPKFIYLSNCYVFDGARGNYHETDTVLPWTALGKAKLGGENFIRGRSLNYILLRSSPLIGRGNGTRFSFLDQVRVNLSRGKRLELPNYDVHSFAPVQSLLELIVRIIEGGVRNKVLHHGGLTKLTHYEWAVQFAKRFGYDSSLLVPSRTVTATTPAPGTMHDYSLNSTQAVELLKIKPFLLQESFDLIDQHLVSGL